MRAHLNSIGIMAFLICCVFLGSTAFADYETAMSLQKSKKYKQGFDECWEDAQKGEAKCQNYIGYAYKSGKGTTQDLKEAVKWYRLAAGQGNAKAQNNLGTCYSSGKGVAQDFKEATRWYQLAADQKQVWGLYNLGLAYLNGKGVKRDNEQAVNLFRLAAEQDYNQAQYRLGLIYETGQGVSQDDTEALKWYHLAADQGHNGAKERLGSLLTKIAINKPAKNLKDLSEERILADISGKTIEGWEIKKEYKNVLKILNRNNKNNPKFIVALFSSDKSADSRTQGFFCKLEIEYKKIAGELFLVDIKTIQSELGKKDETFIKYYENFYPLCSAVKDNNENLVKNLLRRGVDVNEVDNYYWTPLLHAYANKLKNIEKLLISKGADIHLVGATMLAIALRNNDFTSAKELLNRGVDINSKPKTGSKYAESAIENSVGNEAAFQFLVENGANIDVKNYYGGSLLHKAVDCISGNLNVAKYLIEKGLNVNAIASNNGRTPLVNACGCSSCKPEYIKLLLDNGADIKIKVGYSLSDGSTRQGDAYNWAKGSGCIDQLDDYLVKRLRFEKVIDISDTVWFDSQHTFLGSFFRRFQKKISEVWRYPQAQYKQGVGGKLEIMVSVNKKGELIDVSTKQYSGNSNLDFETTQTIYRAAPFGPLPDNYPHAKLNIRVYFEYSKGGGQNIFGRKLDDKRSLSKKTGLDYVREFITQK